LGEALQRATVTWLSYPALEEKDAGRLDSLSTGKIGIPANFALQVQSQGKDPWKFAGKCLGYQAC
jgi:hypothetical protein